MKALLKILAALAAIAAVAALLYRFRDKLKALCPCCKKCDLPVTDEPAEEQETLTEEAPAGEVTEEVATEEVVEEVVEEVAEETAEETAGTVTEEDFAE